MGTASTEILGQPLPHLLLGWMRVAIKDLVSSHDHATDTVTTLCGLFLDEGPLQRVGFLNGSETFYGGDLGGPHGTDLGHAGAHRKTPDQDRAGAALSQSTAKLGAVEPAIVAQDVKERRIFRLPTILHPLATANSILVRRDNPLQMTLLPGGPSLALAR